MSGVARLVTIHICKTPRSDVITRCGGGDSTAFQASFKPGGQSGSAFQENRSLRDRRESLLPRDMHCPFLGFISTPPCPPLLVTDKVLSISGTWRSLLISAVLNSPSPTKLLPCKSRLPFAANSHPCLPPDLAAGFPWWNFHPCQAMWLSPRANAQPERPEPFWRSTPSRSQGRASKPSRPHSWSHQCELSQCQGLAEHPPNNSCFLLIPELGRYGNQWPV